MDRKDSIKTMLIGALGTGLLVNGCAPVTTDRKKLQDVYDFSSYGRTPEEKARDKNIFEDNFFKDHEFETVAVLCDLILPATGTAGAASEAFVPEFIDFAVKEWPNTQDRFRNGIEWLDSYSRAQNGKDFIFASAEAQIKILDEIAYPDKATEETQPGVDFFREIRNFTLTGYYTTEIGYNDLGYVGNRPNIWDGVPQEVLDDLGIDYEEEWIAKCVDQSKRNDIAEWDEEGNLLNN
ncbi:MAG: hypothetical protein BalsKO_29170 [Balneolaceae bacterium]